MPTAKTRKIEEIPSIPLQSITKALRESRIKGLALSRQLIALYPPLLKEYKQEIVGHYHSNFKEKDKRDRPIWIPSVAKSLSTVAILSESFNDMIDSADTEAGSIMKTDLDEEFTEAYDYALWTLYQQGVDVNEVPSLGNFSIRHGILLAAGIAGLSYLDRIQEANKFTKQRYNRWLKATVNGGQPLEATLQGFDQFLHAHMIRITRLAENENHRSLLLGTEIAHQNVATQVIGSVWVTKGPKPCIVCIGKNLEITNEQPIEHSHPGCRCIKVPIALDYRGRPIDYVEFLKSIGRR